MANSSAAKTTQTKRAAAKTDDVAGASSFASNSPCDDAGLDAYAGLPEGERLALRCWASTFFPFQRDWLTDPSPFAIACKARQIGFSHTSGALALIWSAIHGEVTTIISVGKREAKEILVKCARHARVLQSLGLSRLTDMVALSKEEIVFASGGRIIALPSEGGRSFTGNVIIDEFAYLKHADLVWDAAAPVMTLGDFRLRVISTPNGNGNAFANLWEDALRTSGVDWSVHMIPLSAAVAQGMPVNMAKAWRLAKGDPRLFEQFYNCSFIDAVLQYLASSKIDACRTLRTLLADDSGSYYAGLDIGRSNDLTVLTVVMVVAGVARVVHVEEMKRSDPAAIRAMVRWAFKRYHLKRICIDSTGLGWGPSEDIKREHGDRNEVKHRRNKVELVDFSLKTKDEMATNAYSLITSKKVWLPDGDSQLPSFVRHDVTPAGLFVESSDNPHVVNKPGTALEIRKQLASIQRIVTNSGNVTYDTPRTSQGHGDHAWSLLLALRGVDRIRPIIASLQRRAGVDLSI